MSGREIMYQADEIKIVFFSGTGGVKRIAETLEKEIRNRGIKSILCNIDRSKKSKQDCFTDDGVTSVDVIVLLFPVHAFDAPEPVYNWIKHADLHKKQVAVISVSAGGEVWPNTGARNNCCKAMEQGGAEIIYEYMMCMPSNWVFPVDDHTSMWLIKAIPDKVNKILDDILSGNVRRTSYKKGFIRSQITYLEKRSAKNFAEKLMIEGTCTGCGSCAGNCPVENIDMKNRRPVFKDQCVMCFRCVYDCPCHAIKSKSFMVLKDGYRLSEIEKHMQGVELRPIEKCCRGFMWKAVRNYLLNKDI